MRVPVRPEATGGGLAGLVADLARRSPNYAEDEAPPHVLAGWHRDDVRTTLGHEAPGEIEQDGLAETAAALVDGYEFADPAILRAVYRYPGDLVGRDMLLVGRFLVLRFAMGVRITEQHDEVRDGEHRLGWAYQTLDGHLEQGKLTYESRQGPGDRAGGVPHPRVLAARVDPQPARGAGLPPVRPSHAAALLRQRPAQARPARGHPGSPGAARAAGPTASCAPPGGGPLPLARGAASRSASCIRGVDYWLEIAPRPARATMTGLTSERRHGCAGPTAASPGS